MRKDLPDQVPIMSFFSQPIPNSHQIFDTVNCLKQTIDIYSAYNNEKTCLNFGIFYNVIKNRWSNIASQWNSDRVFNIVGHYAAAKQNFITTKQIMKILVNLPTHHLVYQIPLQILKLVLLTDFMIL